jgi:hypothetical protein
MRATWRREMVQLTPDERDQIRELVDTMGTEKAARFLGATRATIDAMRDPYGVVEYATRDRIMRNLERARAGGVPS